MGERDDYADHDLPPPSRWARFVMRLLLAVGIIAVWGLLWQFIPH